ncbi:dinitrogenase iron-molybdenum cofactor biosynthesis protein [Candidatus Bathyarchaeota archaeon]|nr:dinitrogenase iron-molybdenum cofactor biosynthesis protein [Candidatus Bathyarchaeota archaeon]
MKKIAFPVNDQKGIDGTISGHFGAAKYFFLVDVDEQSRDVKDQSFIDNPPHSLGGCMMPVRLLAENGANMLVVGGIGMRPLMGFRQAGITVMHNSNPDVTIGALVKDLDKLPIIDQSTCGGH